MLWGLITFTDKSVTEKLDRLLNQGVIQMTKLSDLQVQVDAVSGKLSEISSDIDDLRNALPAEGGLTAEEVATLSASLDALQAKAGEVAEKHTPDTPEPEA